MKRSPIRPKRHKSGTKVGKTGRVRKYGADMAELRAEVYDRAAGLCEIKAAGCEKYAGWLSGHMHHVRHRSLGGSDSLENCQWSCPSCHRKEHNQ